MPLRHVPSNLQKTNLESRLSKLVTPKIILEILGSPNLDRVLTETLLQRFDTEFLSNFDNLIKVLRSPCITRRQTLEFLKPEAEGGFLEIIKKHRRRGEILKLPQLTRNDVVALLNGVSKTDIARWINTSPQLTEVLESPHLSREDLLSLLKLFRHFIVDHPDLLSLVLQSPHLKREDILSILKPPAEDGFRDIIKPHDVVCSPLLTRGDVYNFLKLRDEDKLGHLIIKSSGLNDALQCPHLTRGEILGLLKPLRDGGFRYLLSDGYELAKALHSPHLTQDDLSNLLKPEAEGGFRHLITDVRHLNYIAKCPRLKRKDVLELLEAQTRSGFRHLITDMCQLAEVLSSPQLNRNDLLELLKPEAENNFRDLITDGYDLSTLLDSPHLNREDVLDLLEPQAKGGFRHLISDVLALITIHNSPHLKREDVLDLLKPEAEGGFRHLITDANELAGVLRRCPLNAEDVLNLLKPPTEDGLGHLIQNTVDLAKLTRTNRLDLRFLRALTIPEITVDNLNALLEANELTLEQQNLMMYCLERDPTCFLKLFLFHEDDAEEGLEEEKTEEGDEIQSVDVSFNEERLNTLLDIPGAAPLYLEALTELLSRGEMQLSKNTYLYLLNIAQENFNQHNENATALIFRLINTPFLSETGEYKHFFDLKPNNCGQAKLLKYFDKEFANAIRRLPHTKDAELKAKVHQEYFEFILHLDVATLPDLRVNFPNIYNTLCHLQLDESWPPIPMSISSTVTSFKEGGETEAMKELKTEGQAMKAKESESSLFGKQTAFFREHGFDPKEDHTISRQLKIRPTAACA